MSDWQFLSKSLTVSTLSPFELFKMKIFHVFLILGANSVVTVVAYYRKCYGSFSLCLITNIEYCPYGRCRLSQSSAADWCERNSSSLAIVTNGTVQAAIEAFIKDPASKLTSDVITDGYRSGQTSWEWINGNNYQNSHFGDQYRYGYLDVLEDRTLLFNGLATSRRKFICSYNLNNNATCLYDYQQQTGLACYKICHEKVTWYDARNLCLEYRSDLAVFVSGLPSFWKHSEQYWIGLRKESWDWRNGQTNAEVTYSNWLSGSPANTIDNCICLLVPSGKWINCNCTRNYRYICMQAYTSNSSSSTKTSTTVRSTRPSIRPKTLPTTTIKIPTTKTKLTTTTTTASTAPSRTTITTPAVGDPSPPFHSTLAPGDDLSYKASEEPANPSESWQSSGLILALGLGSACLLILIGFIVVIVVIKNRRSRSGGVGPRQQDYPPQNIDQAGAPNNVYAIVVPNTSESARFPSERTQSEIVYAELDLAPTEKRTQRSSTPGKTPNQIFHHPAPKGSKRGRAEPESEYANSIPLESVYDNIVPS